MADKVLILAESGSGKSYASRNLNPAETFIINCDEKRLPFKGSLSLFKTVYKDGKIDLSNSNYYETIDPEKCKHVVTYIGEKMPHIKVIIVDTLSGMMVGDFMSRAKNKGYDKFVDMALNTYDLIKSVDAIKREDLTVIFTAHIEKNPEGNIDVMIPGGKLMREKARLANMFTVVLGAQVNVEGFKREYSFITQTLGADIYKSPPDMFNDVFIPNDYDVIIKSIKKYYV